jgi:uncharacterized protein (TIGR02117 family)
MFSPHKDGIYIYISSNGVHTDFVLPVCTDIIDWRSIFNFSEFNKTWHFDPYIAFGWGDKGFYLHTPEWKDLKFKTAFNALFIPSTSAMHVTLWPEAEEDDQTKSVCISAEDYQKIVNYILHSFTRSIDGKVVRIDHPGYGDYDLFFESDLKFHVFRTCNVWTNRGLKEAGIRTSLWTPYDLPILYHLSKTERWKE